ncbi:transmembrane protein 26 [Biomphalaria glabrata]|nr:transmembrane protein 26 [Biomphalaria glabrata]
MLPVFDILKAVFVRCILVIHALVAVWRVTESYHNNMYWILACILVLLFAESCYTVIKRKGKEYQRFMPAFFCYLCTVLTCIWLLELDKTEKFIEGQADSLDQPANTSDTVQIPAPSLTPNTWIMLVEEMLPYFLFVSRWILPRGEVKREQLAELLFAFIGIGGDIMEYFSLLGEEAVRPNKQLCYVVLAIWSFSVMQFTMTITVIHQPKRQRNINVVAADSVDLSAHKKLMKFRHEVSAIFLTMIMQDLPFMIVRLYVMIGFNVVNYSLIFFTSKNIMIISLLFYKLIIICSAYYQPKSQGDDDDDDDDEDDDEDDNVSRGKKKSQYLSQNGSKKELADYTYETETAPASQNIDVEANIKRRNKKKAPKSGSKASNPFPDGKIIVSGNGLSVSPYLFENPSYQHPPNGAAKNLTTRSTNTTPTLLRVPKDGFIEIEHTTPRGDESQDTGFTSEKSRSNSGSKRSLDGSNTSSDSSHFKFSFNEDAAVKTDND